MQTKRSPCFDLDAPGKPQHRGPMTLGLAGLLFASSLLLASCSGKEKGEEAATITVQVAPAGNEVIQGKVTGDAVIYPRDQASIVPKVNAPVKKFYVDRGSRVHAGELLAELENQDLVGTLTENQGGYQQAEVAYSAAAQKAEQDLKVAKQQLDAAQRLYENREMLYKQGAMAAKDVEDARIAYTQAQNQYQTAEKQYDLKTAEGQLTSAKGKRLSAEAELSYTKIVSPINGVVTDRPYYPGETAPSGSPILTVMDISQVTARAHISQQEAAEIKAGDSAAIAAPDEGEDLPAKVTLVSPALDPNSTTVEIWVQAANPKGRLRPGASARVTIVTRTVPHAIVIPASALLTAPDGTSAVYVLGADNKPDKRPVKVGIRSGDDAQIADGLKEGERVISVGAFELDKEDPDVLAKTKIEVQSPKAGDDEKNDSKKDDDDKKKDKD